MPDEVWSFLYLRRPIPIRDWPEAARAWISIALIVSSVCLLVCVLLTVCLLFRLAYDAFFETGPTYQEAARNFLLAFASAFGAPFLVWRTWVAHQQARAADAQARVALENHITGIFSKSVELMGLMRTTTTFGPNATTVTNSSPNLEARLGALYSLERLLSESEKDQRAILETLCAYVRENSPLDIPEDEDQAKAFFRGESPPAPSRRADVQAAITIIGRRPALARNQRMVGNCQLDFRNTNLVAYDFSGLNYLGANFSGSFLNMANLTGGTFDNSIFRNAFLRGANLTKARFPESSFEDCNFAKAIVDGTNFRRAIFVNADLRHAMVASLSIKGANLKSAFWTYGLKHALDKFRSGTGTSYEAQEIMDVLALFQNAEMDEDTKVAQEVRDAIEYAGQDKQA